LNIPKTEILDFWDWFSKNHDQLHSDNFNQDCFDQLDIIFSRVSLSWEIGPGIKKTHSLSISGNGAKHLTQTAKDFIELAPPLVDWEFFPFRQPKENWRHLKLTDKNIDASCWQYTLLKYPDDRLEILVKVDNISTFDKKDKHAAIELVLINLLGEEIFLANFCNSEALNATENIDADKFTLLEDLPDHLKQLNGA